MAPRTADYEPGQVIPGTVYRVHRVIGAGGMGTVYDVEDTTVGRRYVLKTLHSDLADRADLAARLSREARALAKLQHPNIVEVYTSGTTKDQLNLPYYVMERLQGQSLRVVLERKGRVTTEQAIDIAIDLLDALDHAHEFGIVHRDVKPDNLFITRGRDGRSLAKLLDFGIIKLAQSNTIHTGARFIGTFRYAPPEQILGREVTPRSDLYAVGLVLYEMLAGRGPFDDFTGEVEIGKAQVDVVPPPLARFATVPAELDRLVASALAKKAEERPKDAYTFGQKLRELKKQLQAATRDAHGQATVDAVVSAAPSTPESPQNDPATRVDGHDGMVAATEAAQQGTAVPATPRMEPMRWDSHAKVPATKASAGAKQTLLGVAPPSNRVGPEPQPWAPPAIDRAAETRAAAPAPTPQAPRYDTAPIPLVPIRASNDSVEPYVPPSPKNEKNETLGAHTTDAPKGKSPWMGVVIGGVVLAALAGGLGVAWKAHATKAPAVVASPVPTPTPSPTPLITAAPVVTPPAPVASTTPATAPTTTVAIATTKPTAAPTATPTAVPTTTPMAKPSVSASSGGRRPGSGL